MARRKKDDVDRKPFTTIISPEISKQIKYIAVKKEQCYYEIIERALRDFIAKEEGKAVKL